MKIESELVDFCDAMKLALVGRQVVHAGGALDISNSTYGFYCRAGQYSSSLGRLSDYKEVTDNFSWTVSLVAGQLALQEIPIVHRMNGFRHFINGVVPEPESGHQTRFYFNTDSIWLPSILTAIVNLMRSLNIEFSLKFPATPSGFNRADNLVLYLGAWHRSLLEMAFSNLHPDFGHFVRDNSPRFTRVVAPGISWAESPYNQKSFGQDRAEILSNGYLNLGGYSSLAAQDMPERLLEWIENEGFDSARFYLNPRTRENAN